ncbi:hypothetical protein MTBPR1_110056 [Candidatus Terasakiella magnetica]|uniref:Uncharacterized protein n=1 Tax=Candidatus Terasakiella magnetica TaxID=1867952 RepID=A0A1C3REA5_9PROT|nr:hypothetical protein [Candidatus Terasakiella magnetica]SCA55617.1 hypothetical protein MTBPR1_110056 [Candidatus Terasakiella magnetica]
MSDSQNKMNDLAAQYLELWQKQLTSDATKRAVDDASKSAEAFGEQSAEFMKNLDSPQKVQNWMNTWAESWKAQFEDGTNPFSQFAENVQAAQNAAAGAATARPSSEHPVHDVDELSKRIGELEKRVHDLESQLKK